MNGHIGEDAELFALGLLDDQERARVEAHAAACAACSERLGRAEAVVAELVTAYRATPAVSRPLGERSPLARTAIASAVALALGVTLASLVQTRHLQARLSADDAVLATLVTSHFNHAQFSANVRDAPPAKLLNARGGEWLFVIVDRPADDLHVVARREGRSIDLGTLQPNGKTATLFVRDPGMLQRVELERRGAVIEAATPSYAAD